MIELPAPGECAPGETLTLAVDPDGGVIRRSVVEPGVRVLTEAMPASRSVSVGVVVPVGSRDEDERLAGASHFLEHLLFKGTRRRTALQISAAIDAVGGELNAFTTKEYTCFYARVIDRDLPLAVDVLLDMITSALITDADVESEREVVLEEIAMHDDDPAGVAHESLAEMIYAGSTLARPIIGTPASIGAIAPAEVRAHYRRWYTPDNIAVVAAGGLEHDAVASAVAAAVAAAGAQWAPSGSARARFIPLGELGTRRPIALPTTDGLAAGTRASGPGVGGFADRRARQRDTEQVNIVIGMPGLAQMDSRRYAVGVLDAALGGGMSSRLFQEVRERRGLAYSVGSFASRSSQAGSFGVYAGTMPAKADATVEVLLDVLADVAANGLSDDEVARGRGQEAGSLVLGLEKSGARMMELGGAEVATGVLIETEESLAGFDAVTAEDVSEAAATLLAGPRFLSTVGPDAEEPADG